MISIERYRLVVGLYNYVSISRCEKTFVIPLEVGLRYIFYPHRTASPECRMRGLNAEVGKLAAGMTSQLVT